MQLSKVKSAAFAALLGVLAPFPKIQTYCCSNVTITGTQDSHHHSAKLFIIPVVLLSGGPRGLSGPAKRPLTTISGGYRSHGTAKNRPVRV